LGGGCGGSCRPSSEISNCAAGSGCVYLVTGDRTHFGALYGRTIRGVTIVSPRELAEELHARGWIG
jgi:hypothetical protein